jgi:hypothetical protein
VCDWRAPGQAGQGRREARMAAPFGRVRTPPRAVPAAAWRARGVFEWTLRAQHRWISLVQGTGRPPAPSHDLPLRRRLIRTVGIAVPTPTIKLFCALPGRASARLVRVPAKSRPAPAVSAVRGAGLTSDQRHMGSGLSYGCARGQATALSPARLSVVTGRSGHTSQRHGPLHGRPPSPGARLPEAGGCGRMRTGQCRELEVGQCPRHRRLPGASETANNSTHDWLLL